MDFFMQSRSLFIVIIFAAVFLLISNYRLVKRMLVGRPKKTRELHAKHNKLLWVIAFPILSADLYSSVAYGPEAGATELIHLGSGVRWVIIPISIATVLLLCVLIVSYIMGVLAYPNGGGAYTIARENFKKPWVSLLAASSLLIDYILTVAVSISAGIQAVISAYPTVSSYQISLALACVLLILIINLRGVSESAAIFAWPTFLFMGLMLILIATGFMDEFRNGFLQTHTPPFGTVPQGLTTLLVLKAFSSACSALTGIETISNAVPIFRDPPLKGAIKAYLAMGFITGVTLLGFSFQLYVKGVPVDPKNTMLSQLIGMYFDHGIFYQLMTWSTFIILALAANSTFIGFSQLAAMVASDGFLPRSLAIRGDRLGYSNGMIILAALSALLIVAFRAQTNALIPLYAIGVFTAFTVAQLGLVLHWFKAKRRNWRIAAAVNMLGAGVTSLVIVIFGITKFKEGAWIVILIIPLTIWGALAIKKHYRHVSEELKINIQTMQPQKHHVTSIVLISGIHKVVLNTVSFAKSLNEDVIALFIGFDDISVENMTKKWEEWGSPCPLITLKNEYRSLLNPISNFINTIEAREGGKPDHIHLLIAQFIPKRWWQLGLHNQSALLIRAWFLRHKDIVITTVPYHLE